MPPNSARPHRIKAALWQMIAQATRYAGSPKTPQAASPCSWGLPPSTRANATSETKRRAQAPCSWGLGASTSSRRLLAVGPADRPPAEADLALVEDRRLTGGDGALGRVEDDARFVSVDDRARSL